jgi:hypothetical protein
MAATAEPQVSARRSLRVAAMGRSCRNPVGASFATRWLVGSCRSGLSRDRELARCRSTRLVRRGRGPLLRGSTPFAGTKDASSETNEAAIEAASFAFR